MSIIVSNKFVDEQIINNLAIEANLPMAIVEVLIQRGIDTKNKIDKFINCSQNDLKSPFLLQNMDKCVELINKKIKEKKKIVVYGDYDCDGIGAAAIIYLTVKHLGGDINFFIPTRQEDGYGLSIDALERVFELYNPSLIITVDCGITSIEEVNLVKSKGIDIIITDHHLPMKILPNTLIINPKLNDNYPDLCGAGVAIKVAEALTNKEYALGFADICAISTIADIVPLLDDNRIIVKLGLEMLSQNKCRKGIKKLLELGNHNFEKKISTYDIAYKIAPKLNASGRLSNAEKSLKILIEEDETILTLLAQELEEENKVRQSLCTETIIQGKEIIEKNNLENSKIFILLRHDWEGGVIGIAASKICEDYYKPTIMLTQKEDSYKGSCRSINGINIFELLNYCKNSLIQFGGHSLAAGLKLLPNKLEEFIAKANEYIKNNINDDVYIRKQYYDAELNINKIDFNFCNALEKLEPFGYKNPKPNFLISIANGKFNQIRNFMHIKTRVNFTTEIVGFNMLKYLEILNCDYIKNIIVTIENETFKNQRYIKGYIKLIDIANKSQFNAPLFFNKLTLEKLRENYKFFYLKLNGSKYISMIETFNECLEKKYLFAFEDFVKSFFIFLESGLVEICEGFIKTNNKKTKLEKFDLFSLFIEG